MRVVEGDKQREHASMWLDFDAVRGADLRTLPQAFTVRTWVQLEELTRDLKSGFFQGATKQKAAGAFGMALAVAHMGKAPDEKSLQSAANKLIEALPQSQPLSEGILAVQKEIGKLKDTKEVKRKAYSAAQKVAEQEVTACKKIGEVGKALVDKKLHVCFLGHWGWLHEIDWGTATAPAYAAHRDHIPVEAWVCETRPDFKGARLTAWELKNEGIPARIVPDLVAGDAFHEGGVEALWLGVEALYMDGSIESDPGAYSLAAAAHASKIPVYAAAPLNVWHAEQPKKREKWDARQDAIFYEKLDRKGHLEPRRVLAKHQRLHVPPSSHVPASLINSVVCEYGVTRPSRRTLARLLKSGTKKK